MSGAETQSGIRKVLWVTLGLNVGVAASKVAVGMLSGSQAMVADGYHSLVDGSNNVIGLIVVGFAHRPPDAGHPYGHRKFENAAALLIGMALLALSYDVVTEAFGRFRHPQLPEIGLLNWVVMFGTLAVNVFVTRYEAREARRLGSAYLAADAAHTQSDIYVTLGVVGSFAVAKAGFAWGDPVVAIGIAALIAWMGGQILIGSLRSLTDSAVLAAADLERTVRAVPGVQHCDDIRTRGAAGHVYVDLVVHLDGGMSLRDAHEVADHIEEALRRDHPGIVDVVVHLEPAPAPA